MAQSRGHIYERPGRPGYYVRYFVGGRPAYKGSFSTRAMAQSFIDSQVLQAEREEVLGIQPLLRHVTFASYLPRWRESLRLRMRPNSAEAYLQTARSLLMPFFGPLELHRITRADVEKFVSRRSRKVKKAATINRNLNVLSSVFRQAIRDGVARENPTKGMPRGREEIRAMPYLTAEDEARLFATLPGWARLPALVAVDAGLRRSEITSLLLRDVDLSRRTILVRRSKNGKPREVGITLRLREALERHLAAHPRTVAELFLTFDGVALRKSSLTSAMGEAVKRVGLEGFRLHDLRHMHGTRLAERGVPPAVIKAALGHSTLFSTLRYIDHAPRAAARTAAFALDTPSAPLPVAPVIGTVSESSRSASA